MKKLIAFVFSLVVVVYVSMFSVCKNYQHDTLIFKNNEPYCQATITTIGAKLTIETKLLNLVLYPDKFQHWWTQYFRIKQDVL